MPDFTPTLFELRNYQTRPGRRDELIAMFEAIFQDAYAAAGTFVAGSFRKLDDPDRFVWIRAFADGRARGTALSGFYSSDAWLAHRDACNATLVDASDSLLLRRIGGALPATAESHPPAGAPLPQSRILVSIYLLRPGVQIEFAAAFQNVMQPCLAHLGAAPSATFLSDEGENFFPRQNVRSDNVLVSVTRFAHDAALQSFESGATLDSEMSDAKGLLRPFLLGDPAILRLSPTSRSLTR